LPVLLIEIEAGAAHPMQREAVELGLGGAAVDYRHAAQSRRGLPECVDERAVIGAVHTCCYDYAAREARGIELFGEARHGVFRWCIAAFVGQRKLRVRA